MLKTIGVRIRIQVIVLVFANKEVFVWFLIVLTRFEVHFSNRFGFFVSLTRNLSDSLAEFESRIYIGFGSIWLEFEDVGGCLVGGSAGT